MCQRWRPRDGSVLFLHLVDDNSGEHLAIILFLEDNKCKLLRRVRLFPPDVLNSFSGIIGADKVCGRSLEIMVIGLA